MTLEKEARTGPLASTLPTPLPECKSPPDPPKVGSRYLSKKLRDGERYDDYRGVVFLIPDTRYRVAVCDAGRQWILQYRKGKDQWQGRKYFARKERLGEVIQELLGRDAHLAVASRVQSLPI